MIKKSKDGGKIMEGGGRAGVEEEGGRERKRGWFFWAD